MTVDARPVAVGTVVIEACHEDESGMEFVHRFREYQRRDVEEMYLYDPLTDDYSGWVRDANTGRLEQVDMVLGFVSPRAGIRFAPRRREEDAPRRAEIAEERVWRRVCVRWVPTRRRSDLPTTALRHRSGA